MQLNNSQDCSFNLQIRHQLIQSFNHNIKINFHGCSNGNMKPWLKGSEFQSHQKSGHFKAKTLQIWTL